VGVAGAGSPAPVAGAAHGSAGPAVGVAHGSAVAGLGSSRFEQATTAINKSHFVND
jgi:hypothetical protein